MAAGTVNGQVYSFVHIKVVLPSGLPQYLDSIEYSDEEGGEVVNNTAGMPAGYAAGEYKGTCKLEMGFSDGTLFETALAAAGYGNFYSAPAIPITVTYGDVLSGQVPVVDVLEVKFNKRSHGNSSGDKGLKRSYEGVLTKPMLRNGSPAIVRF